MLKKVLHYLIFIGEIFTKISQQNSVSPGQVSAGFASAYNHTLAQKIALKLAPKLAHAQTRHLPAGGGTWESVIGT